MDFEMSNETTAFQATATKCTSQWSDDMAKKIIAVSQRNGRIFATLPDDGSRFAHVERIFDNADVFYCVIKLDGGFRFKAIKWACDDCIKNDVPVTVNAISHRRAGGRCLVGEAPRSEIQRVFRRALTP